jgi:hypothetical protein
VDKQHRYEFYLGFRVVVRDLNYGWWQWLVVF